MSTAAPAACSARLAIHADRVRCHGAAKRRDAEHHEAGQEAPPAPDAVGGAPGGQQQCGQHDRVHIEDPRDVRQRRRGEIVLQRRQRDVHHPQVQDREELSRRHHCQHFPPTPSRVRKFSHATHDSGGQPASTSGKNDNVR